MQSGFKKIIACVIFNLIKVRCLYTIYALIFLKTIWSPQLHVCLNMHFHAQYLCAFCFRYSTKLLNSIVLHYLLYFVY